MKTVCYCLSRYLCSERVLKEQNDSCLHEKHEDKDTKKEKKKTKKKTSGTEKAKDESQNVKQEL